MCGLAQAAQRICGGPEKNPKAGASRSAAEAGADTTATKRSRMQSVVVLSGTRKRKRSWFSSWFRREPEADEAAASLPAMVARSADPKAVAREAVVLVMVGLPARGKSYLSGAVVRHLRLLGVRVRNFNAGELRRTTGAAGGAGAQADFFSTSNQAAKNEREKLAMSCCESLLDWIRQAPPNTSSVGILDATNTTLARRARVLQICRDAAREMADEGEHAPLRVIFLESLCDDPRLLKDNYRMKLRNDDYKGSTNDDAALQDFQSRVSAYEAQYEPLEDRELAAVPEDEDGVAVPAGCIRIFNGGEKIVCCRITSSLVAAPIISLMHSMHLTPRRVLLALQVNEAGVEVEPGRLAALLREAEVEEERPIDVLCSADRSGAELARQMQQLCHAASSVAAPSQGKARHQPRAVLTLRALQTRRSDTGDVGEEESYADLVRRMRSEVLLLIERLPRSVLVVCPGDDVLRVLMAHFLGCEDRSICDMRVPKGKALQLSRDHKGFSAKEVPYPPSRGKEHFFAARGPG